MIQKVVYQDKYFFYFWKPHWLPTSFGKQKSFLDFMVENKDKFSVVQHLYHIFLVEREFWLVNRLDNDTAGLLYFAKNVWIYNKYKRLQQQNLIEKIYLADVYWQIQKNLQINYPIMHHRYLSEKMVVIKKEKDKLKWRWKMHYVTTKIKRLYFDKKNNVSCIKIIITKWIRHQIRAHLASVWYPIVWDRLYNKETSNNILHLWSIGINTDF